MTEWRDIGTAPKNHKILAGYWNELGNWRTITAAYYTQLPWSDEDDQEFDSEYAPEGWYEENDNRETVYPTSHPPSHWMPLPEPPARLGTSFPGNETFDDEPGRA